MTKFKGTTGKWEFVHTHQHPTEPNEWHSVIQTNNTAISIINVKKMSLFETEANAKLIAAAPDLLEAALQIQSEIDTEGLILSSYEKLLSAIKKATE